MRFHHIRMTEAVWLCPLVVAALQIAACDDAVCPLGTMQQVGHCIRNSDLVDADVGSAGQQASTGSAGASTDAPGSAEAGRVDASTAGSGASSDPPNSSGAGGAGVAQGVSGTGGATAGASGGAAGSSAAALGGSAAPEPKCGNGVREGAELCDGQDCISSCETSNACLVARLMGAAATCDAQCGAATETTECKSGDGCCAKGCKYSVDTDCSKSCGDGVVDAPEICEPTSKDKPCPISCDDDDPCTQDIKTGTVDQCNVSCTHMPITSPASGDACCPRSANANTDSDCRPICGNGVVESGEKCDGDCPTNFTCTGGLGCSRRVLSGAGCAIECRMVEITERRSGDGCCPDGANAMNDSDCRPTCGNGVAEPGEKCDGDCPSTASCNDGNACTADSVDGSASQCNAVCKNVRIGSGVKNACGGCENLDRQRGASCTATLQSCTNRGTYECQGTDAVVCNAKMPTSSSEVCDNVDNNCNGQVDEGVLNECGGCGTPHYEPQARPPGEPCAYYWTEDNSGDCSTIGVGKCVGTDTVICDAPKPACAP